MEAYAGFLEDTDPCVGEIVGNRGKVSLFVDGKPAGIGSSLTGFRLPEVAWHGSLAHTFP